MLGRVAATDDHLPFVRTELQHLSVAQSLVMLRQRRHTFSESTETGAVIPDRLLSPAGCPIKADAIFGRAATGIGHQYPAGEVFEAGHHQFDAELARQPSGHADMVGMHMRDDDASGLVRCQVFCQHSGPGRDGFGVVDAGIDKRPAALLRDGPQVDVVERERQRHADPAHAGRHLAGLAVVKRRQRVAQPVAIDFTAVLTLKHLTVG